MADPITILGTAGAIANIIDVLGKVITTFAELRSQWQEADLAVLALESELAALNAALTKIKEWAESCSDDPHHQLTMDLDRCVVCCRLLIGKIDAEMSQFQTTPENRLNVASKLRLLLKTKEFEHIQQMIGKQTAAMTLLLTACNTTMLSKQKVLLEDSNTRKVFEKMEDDTASLLVHRDIDSLMTGTATSITSSRRSMIFDFDSTLFTSRIYQRWIRGSVKKSLLQQQNLKDGLFHTFTSRRSIGDEDDMDGYERSRKIDRDLKQHKRLLRREYKVIVSGDQSRADVVQAMKSSFDFVQPELGSGTGISETRISLKSLDIRLCDPNELMTARGPTKRWQEFSDASAILFVVDMSAYDQVVDPWDDLNYMQQMLDFFDRVINSPWFIKTSIILVLDKLDVFVSKLANSPLQKIFPDFIGDEDSVPNRSAMKYMFTKFSSLNRQHCNLYPCLTTSDTRNLILQTISSALELQSYRIN